MWTWTTGSISFVARRGRCARSYAPSGDVQGAGPGAAEITFDQTAGERPAEPFLVFTANKCGPGAFNIPLWAVFTSPLSCAGLMLP